MSSHRPSLPRAAKAGALTRIRVHCPPFIASLWDRLPIQLQTHIKGLAAEAFSREQLTRVHVQLLERAAAAKFKASKNAYAVRCAAEQLMRAEEAEVEQINAVLMQASDYDHILIKHA
jgi:hypothetical protein